MQVAALLSDLKSLSACDHESALALVTVHKGQPSGLNLTSMLSSSKVDNPDLARAKDLLSLHNAGTGAGLGSGIDAELQQARDDVNRVLRAVRRT